MRLRTTLIALTLLTLAAADPSGAQEAPAYATSPVPARIAASRPVYTGWPKDLTPLPERFLPLRVERSDARVVAISTSDRLPARSEWTKSYWVHTSDDGGKHWRDYFTGLAVSEPYVFFSTSQLPMLGAKTLDLEGETVAPAGKSTNGISISVRMPVMVHIPLEAILADRDGDGVTDLLARHLGLDGSPDAPFVLNATPAAACGPLSDEQRLLAAVVELAGWRRDDWSDPLLIVDDPHRFACIPTGHKVLVYAPGSKGMRRLWTATLPVLTLNAARDRAEGEGWHAELVNGTWHVTPPPAPLL